MPSSSRREADRIFDAAHAALVRTWPVPPEPMWVTSPSERTYLLAARGLGRVLLLANSMNHAA
jgi:hypothetical protein